MIKAVIYDLDDLMVNSYPLHLLATEEVLQEYGETINHVPENIRAGFIGVRVIDMLQQLIEYLHLPTDVQTLHAKRKTVYLKLVRDTLEPMPGLMESLSLFKKNKLLIALTSSAVIEYIDLVLDKFNIRDFFTVIISSEDVIKGKPNPEPYLLTVEKLGLKPYECLVLEDARNGIESAKNAGCWCIAVENPYTPPQDRSRADRIISSLLHIDFPLIESISGR